MTTSSSPGDFVDATHRMVRAVAKSMLGGLPRLRYARVMSVDPIVLRAESRHFPTPDLAPAPLRSLLPYLRPIAYA